MSNDDVYTQRRSRIPSFIDPFERFIDTTTLPASTNSKDQKNKLKSDTAETCLSNNAHVSTTSPIISAFDEEYAFFEEERRREKTGTFYFILFY
jgi:hypothetical protein